ncbi:MAG: hypothetical protein Kow0080_36930 [Candidatus Promineifilaceae bacterium]
MKKTLLVLGVVIAIVAIFSGGVLLGQVNAQTGGSNWMSGMMPGQYGNMMNENQYGPDMMGMMMNSSMMSGQYGDMMSMMSTFSNLNDTEPLTIAEAETAVTDYLTTLNNDNLTLGEIMIFSNHAYAQILDAETGEGAFELLIDPTTRTVFPEPGPNMMWNTEYGMMSGGMMGGQYDNMMGNQDGDMMGGQYGNMMGGYSYDANAEISVTPEQAVELAQTYLDSYLPGKTADNHADVFPGYYTLHIQEDGQPVGMLSVNAYNGQVFLHHWHGDFVGMSD